MFIHDLIIVFFYYLIHFHLQCLLLGDEWFLRIYTPYFHMKIKHAMSIKTKLVAELSNLTINCRSFTKQVCISIENWL